MMVMMTVIPLTYNLSSAGAEKITKNENLALQIENICKVNNVSNDIPVGHRS
jgi:hypothetical protein